jgi:uncharacterized coiled-coil DUF342 family protein
MADQNRNPINHTVYELLVGELESLNERLKDLSDKLNETNIKLTEVSGMKHAINDLKDWRKELEETISIIDLSEIRKDMRELRIFKTQVITIGSVITFLLTVLTVIMKFL